MVYFDDLLGEKAEIRRVENMAREESGLLLARMEKQSDGCWFQVKPFL
jgi:hypothetical protein